MSHVSIHRQVLYLKKTGKVEVIQISMSHVRSLSKELLFGLEETKREWGATSLMPFCLEGRHVLSPREQGQTGGSDREDNEERIKAQTSSHRES